MPFPGSNGLVVHFQGFARDTSALGNYVASDGKQVTFWDDVAQPMIRLLTVNGIPRDQNGAEINEGNLFVPETGFTVDVTFDDRGVSPIDPTSLVITADQDLGGGTIPAGQNLASFFAITNSGASALVTPTWSFPPDTTVTLTANVSNQLGNPAPTETFDVDCLTPTDLNRPFEKQQLWYLNFARHDLDGTSVPDYREDLLLFGLGTDATETNGPSANVDAWTQSAIQTELRRQFGIGTPDPVNIDFLLVQPTGITHSVICVGGRSQFPVSSLPPGATETTGAAWLNGRNNGEVSNCFNGVASVGVYPRSIYYLFRNVPAFQQVFAPLLINPVGNDPRDAVVTANGFDPMTANPAEAARYREIEAGVRDFALATAFILNQEMCHSMGLVTSGKLGKGLLGSYLFGHSTSGHFDDGQGNLMSGNNSTPAPAQPANLALIWDHFVSGRAHFTPLNWAYLTERIIIF